MTTYSAVAADFSKNPYGLVYDNAITENVAARFQYQNDKAEALSPRQI